MSTLLLLLIQLAAASAASITIKEGIAGQVCFVQPLPFASKSYSYTVSVDPTSIQLPEGCDASQILLSPLYTSGSCLNPSDNNKSGCSSSSGTVITGTTSSAGTRVPINSTTPLCNQVFTEGSSNIPLAGATTYARGTVTCGPSSTAYLYFQNNCPAGPGSNQTIFTIQIDYTVNYPSCSSSGYNDYYNNNSSWGSWPLFLGIFGGFVLLFLILAIFGRRRRTQRLQQQQNVQMSMPPPGMPPPPPPPYNGVGGGQGVAMGTPYTGVPPPGYPPPQRPSSMNYVPPPSGPSAVYPSQPVNLQQAPSGGGGGAAAAAGTHSAYPAPEGVAQPAIWYAGGKPPS